MLGSVIVDRCYNDRVFQGPNGRSGRMSIAFCASIVRSGVSRWLIVFGYVVGEAPALCNRVREWSLWWVARGGG